MIIDHEGLLSDHQAILGDVASTNYIDMGHAYDWGPGEEVNLLIRVTADFNTLDSLNIILQTDSASNFSTTLKAHMTQNIALAGLLEGVEVALRIPRKGLQRYMRLYYDVVGTDPTLGKIFAATVVDPT